MRIFHLITHFSLGGAERVAANIAYRAGDQPNNALSLNVLNPGEIAATASPVSAAACAVTLPCMPKVGTTWGMKLTDQI